MSLSIQNAELISVAGIKHIPFQMSRKGVQCETNANYLPLLINSYPQGDERGLSNQSIIVIAHGKGGGEDRMPDFKHTISNRDITESRHYKNYSRRFMTKKLHNGWSMDGSRQIESIQKDSQRLQDSNCREYVLLKGLGNHHTSARRVATISITTIPAPTSSRKQQRQQELRKQGYSKQEIKAIQDWLRWLDEQDLSLPAQRAIAIADAGQGLM